jgi:5-methylthioadenosine/S-adenosylhomocysteine deaminase
MKRLLIKDCVIVPMEMELSESGDLYFAGNIAIEGSTIVFIGPSKNMPHGWEADREISAKGMVAMPGFVNSHTHAAMTLLRGYADDLPLMRWLEEKIWPLESRLQPDDVYWGAMLGIVEMLKGGTTAFADMYFWMDQVAEAVAESGIRACLSRGLIGVQANGDEALRDSISFVKRWHGQANGRINVMLGPHAPYTCPPDYLQKVIACSGELGVGLHIHIAETKAELETIDNLYGKTPVEHLEEIGLFCRPVLAAHCVHLTQNDIEICRKWDVKVVHNPQSNMKLASGVAPVPLMLQAGIKVALGTDGAASNNNLDMMEEMRAAALLHKVFTSDLTVIPSYQALKMATSNGAAALGLEKVGFLSPGMNADLILIDFNKPHLYPCHDVLAHLVYAAQAGDVHTVIIDGEVVMDNRQLINIDVDKVCFEVAKRAKRLTGS